MTSWLAQGKAGVLAAVVVAVVASVPAVREDQVQYRPTVVLQIGVADLDRAIRFYRDTLEFKMVERRDDLQFAHIDTNLPGLQLGLSVGSPKAGTGAAVVNIGVADVAAARRLLESRGVVFSGPTQVIPGKVALAGFADPDGNQLRLAGPPPKR
jgi:catechol 2,3-dioxygenase-like lactoylglutathione lyase family enzyme